MILKLTFQKLRFIIKPDVNIISRYHETDDHIYFIRLLVNNWLGGRRF